MIRKKSDNLCFYEQRRDLVKVLFFFWLTLYQLPPTSSLLLAPSPTSSNPHYKWFNIFISLNPRKILECVRWCIRESDFYRGVQHFLFKFRIYQPWVTDPWEGGIKTLITSQYILLNSQAIIKKFLTVDFEFLPGGWNFRVILK